VQPQPALHRDHGQLEGVHLLMVNKTIADKFAAAKEEILNDDRNFDFNEIARMLLAVNFGWVQLMPTRSVEAVEKHARETAEELLDDAIEYCIRENDEYWITTGGFKAVAAPNGFLELQFIPAFWRCNEEDAEE